MAPLAPARPRSAGGGLVDYHVHVERGPMNRAWLRRFIGTAVERDLDEIGISEHSYRFSQAAGILDIPWAREQCCVDVERYISVVRDAAAGAAIPVRLGVEIDYVEGKEEEISRFIERYDWDYVIGSVHWDGEFAFDHLDARWGMDERPGIYRRYFRLVGLAASSGLFDVLGHFDVVKVTNQRPPGDIGETALAAVEAIPPGRLCVEVSSAGFRRPVGEMYPAPDLLSTCRRRGVPITLASDAHRPCEVGEGVGMAAAAAAAAGYDSVCTFQRRRRTMMPLRCAQRV